MLARLTQGWDLPTSLNEHNNFHSRRVAAAAASGISKSKIEALDQKIQRLLASALTLASHKLETVKPKPDKRYLCRKDKRRLMELIEQGKRARSTYEQGAKDPIRRRELFLELNNLRRERHALTHSIRLANAKKSNARFQNLVSSKPKLANKIINGKLKDRVDPQVLRQQGSDTLLFKAADVLQETHDHFERLNRAPSPQHTFIPALCQPQLPMGTAKCTGSLQAGDT